MPQSMRRTASGRQAESQTEGGEGPPEFHPLEGVVIALPQTNMEAPRTSLKDIAPFAEAFWELLC